MRRIFWRAIFVLLIILVVGAGGLYLLLFRPVAQDPTNDLADLFNHRSIGNEEAQGLPYWIWRVLPQIFPDHLPGNKDGWGTFGLYWQAGDDVPVGLSVRTLGVIPRVAPNCAFCHQGSYRLRPDDPAKLVVAGAGTRVNPQAYIRFLIDVGADPRFTSDRIMEEITGIYDMPWWERGLYRFVLIPATRKALQQQGERFAWMKDRPDWGPGRIDPFNPVKFQNLKLADDGTIGNSDMMPLWSMAELEATNTRRFSLHWDGLQTDLLETVVSGAIGDGMSYKSYSYTKADLLRLMDFISVQGPPPSPFSSDLTDHSDPYYVDEAAVNAGRLVYAKTCADCHDPGGTRYRTPIPILELKTDRHRIDMWTLAARDRYAVYEPGYAWGFANFQKAEGYVATNLRGLWLRGPYLHNGSVPTLRALLFPSERPSRFYRGYDLVDTKDGGFVSAPGTDGEKYGTLYDTSQPGNSNQGHLWGTDLSPEEEEQLLSYLKTL